jgi:hypothetical protein
MERPFNAMETVCAVAVALAATNCYKAISAATVLRRLPKSNELLISNLYSNVTKGHAP